MTDGDIDYSDIPALTDEQLAKMKPLGEVLPQIVSHKVRITMKPLQFQPFAVSYPRLLRRYLFMPNVTASIIIMIGTVTQLQI